jgi:hypothetical protein
MADPTPNRPPLWEVMQDAYFKGRNPGISEPHGYAAEIRAIADEAQVQFDGHFAGRWEKELRIIDWLRAEADRADAGEQ